QRLDSLRQLQHLAWSQMKEQLLEALSTAETKQTAIDTLYITKQRENQSIQDFVHEMLLLCSTAEPDMDDTKKLTLILPQIADKYQTEMMIIKPQTIEELLNKAVIIEQTKNSVPIHQPNLID